MADVDPEPPADHGFADALRADKRLCEVLADPLHEGAAAGFCAVLACGAAGAAGKTREAPRLVFVRQAAVVAETGDVHAAGLADLGLSPARSAFVTLAKPVDVLRAAVDAARCAALDGVIVEIRGDAACLDLTATRRLVLTAAASGVRVILLRAGGHGSPHQGRPSAAWTRWRVRGAPSGSQSPRHAFSLGPPRFDVALLRHRGGCPSGRWIMEWNRERFRLDIVSGASGVPVPDITVSGGPALPRPLVPLSDRRPLAA